jgi:NACalpha-BTF3-like transcription factor
MPTIEVEGQSFDITEGQAEEVDAWRKEHPEPLTQLQLLGIMTPSDLELVMQHAGVDEAKARWALREFDGDVVDAIMYLAPPDLN